MSSSTALLPKSRKDDHPIFLRVCHAPWAKISQKHLVFIRFTIASYLIGGFSAIIDFDEEKLKLGWLAAFDLGNISYLIQLVYAIIALSWTYTHLHYPQNNNHENSDNDKVKKFFSPPKQKEGTTGRFWFSIFYTCATVFPFMVSFIYWAVLTPRNETPVKFDEIRGHGEQQEFYVYSKYIINSVIAFIELAFLSSIKRQTPAGNHIFAIGFIAALYVGWAFMGYAILEQFTYYFFDHAKVGWEYVGGAIIAFGVTAEIFFSFSYGITGIRENLAKKEGHKGDYLPQ